MYKNSGKFWRKNRDLAKFVGVSSFGSKGPNDEKYIPKIIGNARDEQLLTDEAIRALQLAYEGNFSESKEMIKELHKELKKVHLRPAAYGVIKMTLNRAWEQAKKECDEYRIKKTEEWKIKMKAHIDRWKHLIKKNEIFINILLDEINECEQMKEHEKSLNNKTTIINRKLEKINYIKEKNIQLHEKIIDVTRKIKD